MIRPIYNKKGEDIGITYIVAIILMVIVVISVGVLISKFGLIEKIKNIIPNFNMSSGSRNKNLPEDQSDIELSNLAFGRERDVRDKLFQAGIKIGKKFCDTPVKMPDCMSLAELSDQTIDKLTEVYYNYLLINPNSEMIIFEHDAGSINQVYITTNGELSETIFRDANIDNLNEVNVGNSYLINNNLFKILKIEKDNQGLINKVNWDLTINV
ncbi:hypothetical protein J4466_02375 [Candidatus Pacearchaeota archaeon]|nr:hypothetical protein [Candidatus Pacearchaeota archaeon]